MKRIEERTIDKSSWPRGPWDDEPDKIQWLDEESGLPCLIVRAQNGGALCGYVGISRPHPFHGVDYRECAENPPCPESFCQHSPIKTLRVHGRVGYSDKCRENICHRVEPGEPDDVWWLGFDCAHGGDIKPLPIESDAWFLIDLWDSLTSALDDNSASPEYRTTDYVAKHCRDLARQLKEREVPQ